MGIVQKAQSVAINQALNYMEKDPLNNFDKLLDWATGFAKGTVFANSANVFRGHWDAQDSYGQLMRRALTEFSPNVRKKLLGNFFLNTGIIGFKQIEESSKRLGVGVPWTILIDPTTACNLKCVGCWAGEYDKCQKLGFEKMDEIVTQAKELGLYTFIFSGGEPLMCKDEIIRLCEKHQDCIFLAFTNATLIDEALVAEFKRVGNFAPTISIEGNEEETDMRRGKGTYQKIMRAMELLHGSGIPFGASVCYHSKNYKSVVSDEFIENMISKGCFFGWYFTYMPIGKDAVTDLMVTPEQREYVYHALRAQRDDKPMWLMDFWNDGEFVGGCIAGGRCYFHINAAGDCEPCAFIHYATANINNCTLEEALKSSLFHEYQVRQPMNKNLLRPCPLLDNPQLLRDIVDASGAYSTQPIDEEDVHDLTAKCDAVAEKWGPVADRLWDEGHYCYHGLTNPGLGIRVDVEPAKNAPKAE